MRDKRPVDELSIEELERILVMRKREARQERLRRYEGQGRRLPIPDAVPAVEISPEPPHQHEAAEHLRPVEPPVTYDITDEMPRFEDDLDDDLEPRRKPPKPQPTATPGESRPVSRKRQAWDRLLLVVEVIGVAGIIAVLGLGTYFLIIENDKIDALTEKSAVIQREADSMRATPTPAPLLTLRLADYVIPGGHYSPDKTGGLPAFNPEELPESIRPMAMAQLNAPKAALPPPQPINPKRIVVDTPKVKIDASIYSGDDWYSLQKGVGHLTGSANPGERANMILTAHNDIFGELFRDIEYLEPGDEVRIQANNGQWYVYVVKEKKVVWPDETWVLERGNKSMVTLITCWPYRVDDRRMVVFADLVESE